MQLEHEFFLVMAGGSSLLRHAKIAIIGWDSKEKYATK